MHYLSYREMTNQKAIRHVEWIIHVYKAVGRDFDPDYIVLLPPYFLLPMCNIQQSNSMWKPLS